MSLCENIDRSHKYNQVVVVVCSGGLIFSDPDDLQTTMLAHLRQHGSIKQENTSNK